MLVTFVAGLIPVVGNLISNSVIVLLSLGVGPGVALASLVFLIVIHKLEYFLNARIVGGEIHASAWENFAGDAVLRSRVRNPRRDHRADRLCVCQDRTHGQAAGVKIAQ